MTSFVNDPYYQSCTACHVVYISVRARTRVLNLIQTMARVHIETNFRVLLRRQKKRKRLPEAGTQFLLSLTANLCRTYAVL